MQIPKTTSHSLLIIKKSLSSGILASLNVTFFLFSEVHVLERRSGNSDACVRKEIWNSDAGLTGTANVLRAGLWVKSLKISNAFASLICFEMIEKNNIHLNKSFLKERVVVQLEN